MLIFERKENTMNTLVLNCLESLQSVLKEYDITNYDINHDKDNSSCLILNQN